MAIQFDIAGSRGRVRRLLALVVVSCMHFSMSLAFVHVSAFTAGSCDMTTCARSIILLTFGTLVGMMQPAHVDAVQALHGRRVDAEAAVDAIEVEPPCSSNRLLPVGGAVGVGSSGGDDIVMGQRRALFWIAEQIKSVQSG